MADPSLPTTLKAFLLSSIWAAISSLLVLVDLAVQRDAGRAIVAGGKHARGRDAGRFRDGCDLIGRQTGDIGEIGVRAFQPAVGAGQGLDGLP